MKIGFNFLKSQQLVIIVIISILLCLALPLKINAQEKVMRTLTVTGEGKEIIATSLTQVQLGVEIQGKTAAEVQQKVAQQTTAVVNLLRSRNVQKLQTTGIGLQPNYNYDNNDRTLIGYIGTNTVSFSLETDKIGSLLDDAVDAGATRIDGVSFTATDSAIDTAQKQALQNAVKNAQLQAEAVLSTLNFSSQDVLSIQINGANVPQPLQKFSTQALARDSAVSTPVVGGEQTVTASVTLQIKY
jgi:uncharacterized protein YggE